MPDEEQDDASVGVDLDFDLSGIGTANSALPEDVDEETLEYNSVFTDLRRAFMNEKLAPELLFYRDELVDQVKELLEEQQDKVDEAEGMEPFACVFIQLSCFDCLN